jgi:tyrosyl-tRNA synthetase
VDVFNGVPQVKIQSTSATGSTMVEILVKTGFLKSNGDARRALKENSIYVNKKRVTEDYIITEDNFINNKFIVLQRGKKNYFVINIEN